jgi:hypothetical protein
VSSDYHSRKCLYFVDMNVFARLIRQAGEERIERLEMERYSNGDYSVNLYSLSETGSEIP